MYIFSEQEVGKCITTLPYLFHAAKNCRSSREIKSAMRVHRSLPIPDRFLGDNHLDTHFYVCIWLAYAARRDQGAARWRRLDGRPSASGYGGVIMVATAMPLAARAGGGRCRDIPAGRGPIQLGWGQTPTQIMWIVVATAAGGTHHTVVALL